MYTATFAKTKVIAYMIYKIEQIKEIAGKPEITEDRQETDKKRRCR